MKAIKIMLGILFTIIYTAISNAFILIVKTPLLCLAAVTLLFISNIFIGLPYERLVGIRLKAEQHGVECLKVFLCSAALSVALHIWLGFRYWESDLKLFILSCVWAFVFLAVLFWNGIISVYVTSVQLGIKIRVIGLILGWIPIANLIALFVILGRCNREVNTETEKTLLNHERQDKEICKTKYPILLVHGVFFRDYKLLDYWGRIPNELKKNGAVIYYGEHQSAASVKDSAAELSERINDIIEQTGCEKVNIIAHSKGGLDCRCAINDGLSDKIASLTTINTPHRGCGFADYLLGKIPKSVQRQVERAYNAAARKLGDTKPDFMAAVNDLTAEKCTVFDREFSLPDGVFCQSVGSELKKATGGKFPLNMSFGFVKHFDGANDGLVSRDSFEWGEKFTFLSPPKKRGISHGDMIDLNRENIPGFDVREFYVQLVADLKERGL